MGKEEHQAKDKKLNCLALIGFLVCITSLYLQVKNEIFAKIISLEKSYLETLRRTAKEKGYI